jgi:uncharacterized small protein (DUF1192 family)
MSGVEEIVLTGTEDRRRVNHAISGEWGKTEPIVLRCFYCDEVEDSHLETCLIKEKNDRIGVLEAENERLRKTLKSIELNSWECDKCSASYIALKALGDRE